MRSLNILLVLTISILLIGCSEDDPVDTIRYEWPEWSYDDNYVLSLYSLNPQNQASDSPLTFSLLNTQNNSESFFNVPKIDPAEPVRFWVANDLDLLVIGGGGLRVADFGGNVVLDQITTSFNVTPNCISFAPNNSTYYWAASESNRIVVGKVSSYLTQNLSPVNETLVFDSTSSATIEDLISTGDSSCAILLSDGTILRITDAGNSQHLFTSSPVSSSDVGVARLKFLERPSDSLPDFLYVLDAEGLKRQNLRTYDTDNLLPSKEGNLLSYDVDQESRTVLFITSGNQVWLASENASPIQALLFEHNMASFSRDGTQVAAVGYVNGAQNRVSALKFKQ